MPKFSRSNSYNGKQSNQHFTGDTRAATAAEAAAGDAEQLYISPATLASAVGGLVPSATTLIEGVVLITDNSSPVATKAYADALAIAGAPAWSETVSGIGQLATTAEAQAATNDNVAMTPLKVSQQLATPPAIGGTTPAAGAFTTLDASGLISVATKISYNGGAATDAIGTATLVGGTVTVNNTNIAATDRIFITRNALNATPALGFLVYTISAGASFTVASYSVLGAAAVTDVSSFSYVIIGQT